MKNKIIWTRKKKNWYKAFNIPLRVRKCKREQRSSYWLEEWAPIWWRQRKVSVQCSLMENHERWRAPHLQCLEASRRDAELSPKSCNHRENVYYGENSIASVIRNIKLNSVHYRKWSVRKYHVFCLWIVTWWIGVWLIDWLVVWRVLDLDWWVWLGGWLLGWLIYCEVSVLVGRYGGWWMNLLNCLFIAKLEDLLFGRLVARSAAG